jgi:hypothetical protein
MQLLKPARIPYWIYPGRIYPYDIARYPYDIARLSPGGVWRFISAVGSWSVLDRCVDWQSANAALQRRRVPSPWHGRPARDVPQRNGAPSLRPHDALQLCCARLVPWSFPFVRSQRPPRRPWANGSFYRLLSGRNTFDPRLEKLAILRINQFSRESQMSKMPPIPPGNQSTKGPELDAEGERDTSKGNHDIKNSAEQGDTANIKQNTTNAGFFKGRRVK